MEDQSPIQFLNKVREEWLRSEAAASFLEGKEIAISKSCEINSNKWEQKIYPDFSGERKFVIFEISKTKMLGEEKYTIGAEIINGNYSSLTSEQLWKEGIP